VYTCDCCEETVIVAPGLHPREDELGPATVYVLESVLANPGRGLFLATYMHGELAERGFLDEHAEEVLTGVGG
jgi:hypothetical protein